jgi:EAL domain-containing protein (putative c-di-GMP-specific phosphodiesterase class I)
MISPARFIPLAEECGLIHRIGDWVLHTACRQGKAWLDRGLDFGRVAVNIAGPQVRPGLAASVRAVLAETGLPAERLELEVTEGFIMRQAESAIDELRALRRQGVALAIDDFGTGYSSLSYLKRLPIHKIKIDQSFVRDLPGDSEDAAITLAVIALGKSLERNVIAEGVETQEQADYLAQAGCQEAQGYFYSRPEEAHAIERWFGEV